MPAESNRDGFPNNLTRQLKSFSRYRYILVVRYILCRLGLKYVRMLVYGRSLDSPIPEIETRVPVHVKIFSAGDASSGVFRGVKLTSGDDPVTHDKTLSRIASGNDVCLVATVNGVAAGYAWILLHGTNYEPAIEREERFANGQSLIYQRLVFQEFRKLNIGDKLNEERLRFLREHGYKYCWIYVQSDNVPAIRSNEKVGFHLVKTITILRIFGFKRLRERAVKRAQHEGHSQ